MTMIRSQARRKGILVQPDATVNPFGSGAVSVFQTHPRGTPRCLPIMRNHVFFENEPSRVPR